MLCLWWRREIIDYERPNNTKTINDIQTLQAQTHHAEAGYAQTHHAEAGYAQTHHAEARYAQTDHAQARYRQANIVIQYSSG
jgi:hypothetical protein